MSLFRPFISNNPRVQEGSCFRAARQTRLVSLILSTYYNNYYGCAYNALRDRLRDLSGWLSFICVFVWRIAQLTEYTDKKKNFSPASVEWCTIQFAAAKRGPLLYSVRLVVLSSGVINFLLYSLGSASSVFPPHWVLIDPA